MKSSKLLSQIKTLLNAKLNLAQQTLEDGVTIIKLSHLRPDKRFLLFQMTKELRYQ